MSKGKLAIFVLLVILVLFGVRACHSLESEKVKETDEEITNEKENAVEDVQNANDDEVAKDELELEEIEQKSATKGEGDGGEIDRTAEQEAIQKYGADVVDHAKETAKKAVELWINENPDEAQWKAIATDDFYKEKAQYLGIDMQGMSSVKRKVTKLEPVFSASDEDNHMNISFNTEMDILSNNQVVNHQTVVYDVDMVKDGETWVVSNIIEYTNHLGNE